MKKAIDLTDCNTTDEICDKLEDLIIDDLYSRKSIDEAVSAAIEEYEASIDKKKPNRKPKHPKKNKEQKKGYQPVNNKVQKDKEVTKMQRAKRWLKNLLRMK